MRRKAGTLVPLEVAILAAFLDLRGAGVSESHGFRVAKELRDREGAKRLTAHGTLYKALGRLEKAGYLASRWEDQPPDDLGRPRRRLYHVTAEGEAAFAAVPQPARPSTRLVTRPGQASS
jgi:DNA-binding PadR family transcriptional regulator